MRFEFATATRIVFGPGSIVDVARLMDETGLSGGPSSPPRVLVVTGSDIYRAEPLLAQLQERAYFVLPLSIEGEPTVGDARRGAELARQVEATVVISIGGGSAIDAGKAIAALATNPGDVLDYLEVIGGAKPLPNVGLPFIAIPTTSGTGSEVTRNAVLASDEHRVKVSLRSPHMLARLAIIDPELTHSLPPAVTAASGLDALTQLIEAFVGTRANLMTDGFCREGITRAARSLRRAYRDGEDARAREDMSAASLLGGLALANAGLGAVHGFAGPIGGMFDGASHGAVCAVLLPQVMDANIQALRAKGDADADAFLSRYAEVAAILTGQADVRPEDGVEWVRQLVRDLNIAGLGDYGVEPAHADDLIAKAQAASSMKANPILLSADELKSILLAAL